MSSDRRVERQPAFLLHQRPWRNSSQLLELLSVDYGRVGLIARGSRNIATGKRALLQPFRPLRVAWSRRGELGTLVDVEAGSGPIELTGQALLAGYYVSELVLTLTTRDDPHPELFAHYAACLGELGDGQAVAAALRVFELRMLRTLGFGLNLDSDPDTGLPLQSDRNYIFDVDGPRCSSDGSGYAGAHLIAMRDESLDDTDALRTARRLLGEAIRRQLGSRKLKTRDVLSQIDARGLLA